jgi:hypothetical protein
VKYSVSVFGPPSSSPKENEIPLTPSRRLSASEIDARMENVKVRALQRAGLDPTSSPKSPHPTSGQIILKKNEVSTSAFEEIKRATSTATSGTRSPSVQSADSNPEDDEIMLSLPPPPLANKPLEELTKESIPPSLLVPEIVDVPQTKELTRIPVKKPPPPLSMMSSLESALDDLNDDQILSPLKEIPLPQQKISSTLLRKQSSNSSDYDTVTTSKIPIALVKTSSNSGAPLPVIQTSEEIQPHPHDSDTSLNSKRNDLRKGQSLMSFESRQSSAVEEDLERDLTAQDLFSRMGSLKQKMMQTSSKNFSTTSFDGGNDSETYRSRSGSNLSSKSGTSNVMMTMTNETLPPPIPKSKILNPMISSDDDSRSSSVASQSIATNTTQLSAMERLKLKVQQSKAAKG